MSKIKQPSGTRVLWFPGESAWERWNLVPGRDAKLENETVAAKRNFPANGKAQRVLALPVDDVIALPLLSNAPDENGLAGTAQMQAERSAVGGNLEGVGFEILTGQPPATLLRVEAPLEKRGGWEGSVLPDFVCSSANALPWQGDSIAVWRELGNLVVGFSKSGRLVFFDRLSSADVSVETGSEIQRLLFQLSCQGIEIRPTEIQLWTAGDAAALQNGSGLIVRQLPDRPAPVGDLSCELTPAWLRSGREKNAQRKILRRRLGAFAAAAMLVIGAFVAMGVVESMRQSKLRDRIAQLAPIASRIENMRAQWDEVSPAVDREATPLEILKTLQETDGAAGVNFSRVEISDGKIAVEGESTSPRGALQFLDAVSLSEKMAEFGWEFEQPEIRADGTATFKIEGLK